MKMINVQEYGIYPGKKEETTYLLRNLLNCIRCEEEVELVFPEGEYHFYPDEAEEILLFIPNHDEDTIKNVAFNLTGMKKLIISGNDSVFCFHTEILPFLVRECDEVEIRGVCVDYERPGHSQGMILECTPDSMTIQVDKKEFPYYIRGGRLYFIGENYCHELVRWMELDGKTQKPVYGLTDRTFHLPDAGETGIWRELEPGILRIDLMPGEKRFEQESKQGDYLILRHHPRNAPAFYLENSRNVILRDIDIYHATGMGVLAQRTENILLEQVCVVRHPDKKHVFTAEADALHFVSCRGSLQVKRCLLENQLDDPLNVHGIYGRIKRVINDDEFLVELVHHQQKGAILLEGGERFRLIDSKTMLPITEDTAVSVTRLNRNEILVKAKNGKVSPGWVIENMEWRPKVVVEGCTFRNNRARGLLLTSGENVLVRDNVFQVPGAGILIEGDCNDWFESGAVTDVRIEKNIFDCCAYVTQWGRAPIQISPSAPKYEEGQAFHGTVTVKDNLFRCFDERLLWARNTEKIVWKNNQVERVYTYPEKTGKAFVMEHVLQAEIEEWKKD